MFSFEWVRNMCCHGIIKRYGTPTKLHCYLLFPAKSSSAISLLRAVLLFLLFKTLLLPWICINCEGQRATESKFYFFNTLQNFSPISQYNVNTFFFKKKNLFKIVPSASSCDFLLLRLMKNCFQIKTTTTTTIKLNICMLIQLNTFFCILYRSFA